MTVKRIIQTAMQERAIPQREYDQLCELIKTSTLTQEEMEIIDLFLLALIQREIVVLD